jgi:hypothetical protein
VARIQQGLQQGARIGAATHWHDKPPKQLDLLVGLAGAIAAPSPAQQQCVVGVEVGQRYLAVTTDPQNHIQVFPGTTVRAQADHFARLRKRLQQQGTRSVTRRVVEIAGRGRRLKQERNHLISRQSTRRYRTARQAGPGCLRTSDNESV